MDGGVTALGFPQIPVGRAVENAVNMWMRAAILWTVLWVQELLEESSEKPLRAVAPVP